MIIRKQQFVNFRNDGSVLALTAFAVFVLAILGVGVLTLGYGARMRPVVAQKSISAKLIAEAGYESAIYWMNSQADVLNSLKLAGDTARQATSPEVKDLRSEAAALKEVVAELTLENR